MAKARVDEFHWHELLDRTYLLQELVDGKLLDHTATKSLKKNDPIRDRLERASEALADAYQLIGEASVRAEKKR